jgi:hypothetical protein
VKLVWRRSLNRMPKQEKADLPDGRWIAIVPVVEGWGVFLGGQGLTSFLLHERAKAFAEDWADQQFPLQAIVAAGKEP